MNSVAHPARCNSKHPAQLSTAQKADRRARRYVRFHAFQSEEKRDERQEFNNSFKNSGVRSQELQNGAAAFRHVDRDSSSSCDEQWIRRRYLFAPLGICLLPPASCLLTSDF